MEGGNSKPDDAAICGIIRPIASMGDDYPVTHWLEVHQIIAEAADRAGYRLRLVSESDQAGIIVSQIVNNLAEDPIVICDVSGRNPNVMFELGMRVTFQKPVIIVTDDQTPFTFDISAISHLQYRRDLRLGPTREFQSKLARTIIATVEASSDPKQRDYLQQFGPINVTGLRENDVDVASLASNVRDISAAVQQLMQRIPTPLPLDLIQNKARGVIDHVERFRNVLAPDKFIMDPNEVDYVKDRIGSDKLAVEYLGDGRAVVWAREGKSYERVTNILRGYTAATNPTKAD